VAGTALPLVGSSNDQRVNGFEDTRLVMQTDGNFVVYGPRNEVLVGGLCGPDREHAHGEQDQHQRPTGQPAAQGNAAVRTARRDGQQAANRR